MSLPQNTGVVKRTSVRDFEAGPIPSVAIENVTWGKVTETPSTLEGYGIANANHVHTFASATVVSFANPLGRLCNVTVYDSSGRRYYPLVEFSADASQVTIKQNSARSGKAVLS